MVIQLIGNDEIRYNRKKEDIVCRMCKSEKTRISSNGELIWIKEKNIRREWTGQFLCYDCNYNKEKICCKCGAEQIIKSIAMFRHYIKGIWSGNFICRDCYYKDHEAYKNRNIILKIEKGEYSILDTVIANILDVPTYSIYIADKKLPFSIIHEYYGIVGIKISKLRNNNWYFNIRDRISADTYFLIGFDEELKNICALYIVPSDKKEYGCKFIVHKNSKKYTEYKVDHEPYNEIYRYLKEIGKD